MKIYNPFMTVKAGTHQTLSCCYTKLIHFTVTVPCLVCCGISVKNIVPMTEFFPSNVLHKFQCMLHEFKRVKFLHVHTGSCSSNVLVYHVALP